MSMADWNAPGFYYKLWYGRFGESLTEAPNITDPTIGVFNISDPGYFVRWEFQIQAGNDEGLGPRSPLASSYLVQDPPSGRAENVTVETVTVRTVELSWRPVSTGSVDGYRVSCSSTSSS